MTDDLLRRCLEDFLRCCCSSSSSHSSPSSANARGGGGGGGTPCIDTSESMHTALSNATCTITRLRDKCGTTVGPHIGTGACASSTDSSGMAVVLSPPTAEAALRSIHAAFRLLLRATCTTITTATTMAILSFLSQTFACLENDLLFTAMRLPIESGGDNIQMDAADPFRILSAIILDTDPSNDGTIHNNNNNNSSSDGSITEGCTPWSSSSDTPPPRHPSPRHAPARKIPPSELGWDWGWTDVGPRWRSWLCV